MSPRTLETLVLDICGLLAETAEAFRELYKDTGSLEAMEVSVAATVAAAEMANMLEGKEVGVPVKQFLKKFLARMYDEGINHGMFLAGLSTLN
jgi:hypothetical protein